MQPALAAAWILVRDLLRRIWNVVYPYKGLTFVNNNTVVLV